jgi:hypothetical protein
MIDPRHDMADEDVVTEARLVEVLGVVPRGALLLCGFAVSTLLLAWIAVYIFLFLARGFVD